MEVKKIKDWLKEAQDNNHQFYFQYIQSDYFAVRIKDKFIFTIGKKAPHEAEIINFDSDCIHVDVSVSGGPIITVEMNSLPDSWSYAIEIRKRT